LILVDVFPNEAKVVEFEAPAAEPVPAEGLPNGSVPNGHATTSPASSFHIALGEDAPNADPPESFEVR
jgi:hypothetical protein